MYAFKKVNRLSHTLKKYGRRKRTGKKKIEWEFALK